jgi:exodeoxyribonuclease VII large subunit
VSREVKLKTAPCLDPSGLCFTLPLLSVIVSRKASTMDLSQRTVLTVTELTQEIKDLLEGQFPSLWVEGEISNLRIPPSGHVYFTLKDESSQIRAVLFRMQARAVRFKLEDGLQVVCRGRVSLYEKRGEYQIILEALEPKGIGALQLAFVQLKERLEKEGLFDPAHKIPIPMVPQKIGIVTSPTGAVIRDMLHILERRFRNVHVLLYPARVQGEGASAEIAQGIDCLNEQGDVDVIIVGRGGGSMEDLWPFNEEVVARAIYRSRIPIVSAVGHETDYTISDFVSDLRAPTPSAAAEIVVRDKREIRRTLSHLASVLENHILQVLQDGRTTVTHLRRALGDPRKMIEGHFLRTDETENRLRTVITGLLKTKRTELLHQERNLLLRSPGLKIEKMRWMSSQMRKRLTQSIVHLVELRQETLKGTLGRLGSLSPLGILQRGYSIARKIPSLRILRNAAEIAVGERVEVKLAVGQLICAVEKTELS